MQTASWTVIYFDGAYREVRHRPAESRDAALRQARAMLSVRVRVARIEGPGNVISGDQIETWMTNNPVACAPRVSRPPLRSPRGRLLDWNTA